VQAPRGGGPWVEIRHSVGVGGSAGVTRRAAAAPLSRAADAWQPGDIAGGGRTASHPPPRARVASAASRCGGGGGGARGTGGAVPPLMAVTRVGGGRA